MRERCDLCKPMMSCEAIANSQARRVTSTIGDNKGLKLLAWKPIEECDMFKRWERRNIERM